MIYSRFFSGKSDVDNCTMFSDRTLINRRNVSLGGALRDIQKTAAKETRHSVVKQSFFGLPGQYGRRVTRVNSVSVMET